MSSPTPSVNQLLLEFRSAISSKYSMCTTDLEVISSNLSRLIVSGATVKDYDKMLDKTFTTKWFATRGFEINGSSINEDNPRNKKLIFDILPAWASKPLGLLSTVVNTSTTTTTTTTKPLVEETINSGCDDGSNIKLNSPRYCEDDGRPSTTPTKMKSRLSRKTFCQDLAVNICDPENTYYWILIWLVRFTIILFAVCALSYLTVNVASKYVGEATMSAAKYIPKPIQSIISALFPPESQVAPPDLSPKKPSQPPIKSTVEMPPIKK